MRAIAAIKVYSLGVDLDAVSLYADYSISKSELSKLLKSSRTSIYKWGEIAWRSLSDFRTQTPQDEDGAYLRDSAFTPYQVWLISRIQHLMNLTRSEKKTKHYIAEHPEIFSHHRFEILANIIQEQVA